MGLHEAPSVANSHCAVLILVAGHNLGASHPDVIWCTSSLGEYQRVTDLRIVI